MAIFIPGATKHVCEFSGMRVNKSDILGRMNVHLSGDGTAILMYPSWVNTSHITKMYRQQKISRRCLNQQASATRNLKDAGNHSRSKEVHRGKHAPKGYNESTINPSAKTPFESFHSGSIHIFKKYLLFVCMSPHFY